MKFKSWILGVFISKTLDVFKCGIIIELKKILEIVKVYLKILSISFKSSIQVSEVSSL